MRQYELALIIHPDLEEAAFKEMLDKVAIHKLALPLIYLHAMCLYSKLVKG